MVPFRSSAKTARRLTSSQQQHDGDDVVRVYIREIYIHIGIHKCVCVCVHTREHIERGGRSSEERRKRPGESTQLARI